MENGTNSADIFESTRMARLEQIRSENALPTLGVALIEGDMTRAYVRGLRKLGYSTGAMRDDKFHLGSCTKMMTSTVIAMAIEEELLTWETSLANIFDFDIDNKFKNVTIAMLGAHQSGIVEDLGQFNQGQVWAYLWNLSGNIPLEQYWIQRPHVQEGRLTVAREILKPRSQTDYYYGYSYNNINYIILGAILERLYQKDWEEIITEKLFAPLGMDSAGFGPQASNTNADPDQPWGHTLANNQLIPYYLDNPPSFGPAGTVHVSLQDWAKFIQFHINGFNGQSNPLLNANSFNNLHKAFRGNSYTSGGWVRTSQSWTNGLVLFHNGSNTLNYALVLAEPQKNRAILIVYNEATKGPDNFIPPILKLLGITTIPPTIILGNSANLTYFEGMPAIVLSQELKLTTDWDNFINATIRIINAYPGDTLTLADQLNANILSHYNAETGELGLSGLAPTNAYQMALRSVSYTSASSTLSNGFRQISFMASDGQFITEPATLNFQVVATSSTPMVSPNAVPSESPLGSPVDVPIEEAPISVPEAVSVPVTVPLTMPEMQPTSFPVSMPNIEVPLSSPVNPPFSTPAIHIPISNPVPGIKAPENAVSSASILSAGWISPVVWFGKTQHVIQLALSSLTSTTPQLQTLSTIAENHSFEDKSQPFTFSGLASSVDTFMNNVSNQLLFWRVGWTLGKQAWQWLTIERSKESSMNSIELTGPSLNQEISQLRLSLKCVAQYQSALATIDAEAAEAYDFAFDTHTETLHKIIQDAKSNLCTLQTLKEDVAYLLNTVETEYKAHKYSANITSSQTVFFKPSLDIKKLAIPAKLPLAGTTPYSLINDVKNQISLNSHLLAK